MPGKKLLYKKTAKGGMTKMHKGGMPKKKVKGGITKMHSKKK